MLRIKTLTLSILISIAVPWDWIEHDGNYIDRSRVVITLSSDRAPKLGQEPPIELDRQLDIFQGIDTERINIFMPLSQDTNRLAKGHGTTICTATM